MKIQERILGRCSVCKTTVTKIINSSLPTFRNDGIRFVYSEKPDFGWCIYRCDKCKNIIDETWKPLC